GHLIKEAAAQAAALLTRKRVKPSISSGSATIRPAIAQSQPARFQDHPMMRACRMAPAPYTPIWLMRQAGRYMPEYRRVRQPLTFLEMCRRPEVAAEVTVTAVERLKVDAAIIFADILLPLLPMNLGLHYEKGDGPLIERPVRTLADLQRIGAVDAPG